MPSPEVSQELADLAGKPANKLPHASEHPSLAAHSVGELYPCDVRGIGDDWQAVNLLTGLTGTRYKRSHEYSYTLAESECKSLELKGTL